MKAVLVIDMLEDSFREGPLAALRGPLTDNINRLTAGARARGIPVIWVRQEFRPDLADAFPVMRKENIRVTIAGTRGSRILGELKRGAEDQEIVKKRYSAFFGTGLDGLLAELGVTELLIAGINTHACVRAAAVDAYQRDLEVTIPRDCVASYDAEHHDITLRYLGRHICRVENLDELFGET